MPLSGRRSQTIQGANGKGNEFTNEPPRYMVENKMTFPEIPYEEILTQELLGRGSFGSVYKAAWRGITVAVKFLPVDATQSGTRGELEFLSHLDHECIVRFIGVSVLPEHLVLVEEYVSGGTLYSLLHGPNSMRLSMNQVLRISMDVATALEYLHPTVVHRDLKSSNVLIDDGMRAKVCDFSIAKFKMSTYISTLHLQAGTPVYMAPEIFEGERVNEKCDQYAFAILVAEMLTGEEPFGHLEGPLQVIYAVSVEHERPNIPSDCPEKLRQLLHDCWAKRPELRPPFSHIRQELGLLLSGFT